MISTIQYLGMDAAGPRLQRASGPHEAARVALLNYHPEVAHFQREKLLCLRAIDKATGRPVPVPALGERRCIMVVGRLLPFVGVCGEGGWWRDGVLFIAAHRVAWSLPL